MESASSTSIIPVGIQPKNVFGLRTDVKGNIHFTAKQEVIYPVAGVLAIQDFTTNSQKFLRFIEHSQPTVIAMSPNRKFLAVGEKYEKSWINIYDLASLKRRKTLHLPAEIPTPEPESICFTCDSKGVAVLSKEPDAFMTIFFFDKAETIVMGRVSNSGQKALSATHLACNLSDTGLIAVGGSYTLKLMSRQEKGFSIIGTITGENKIVTSLMWLMPDILIVGTAEGHLHIIEGGDPKFIYEADAIDVIDLAKVKESKDDIDIVPRNGSNGQEYKSKRKDVNCLTFFQKGFAYAIKNVLYVFEKESNYKFKCKTILTIPIDIYDEHLYVIINIAINAQMDTVIVTTLHSQIYIGILFVPETLHVKKLEFKILGEPLHIDRIVSMSVCSWKPIIITSALDQTIRIWNYDTGKVELVKKYQIDVTVVALHPSGIFVAVGFSDQMRLMEIQLDDLKLVKTFNYPKCQVAGFSHQGHMLACGYGSQISIISVFSFQAIKTFNGHNGEVLSLEWSSTDEALITSGDDGAVYEWNVTTGKRNNECIEKNTIYTSLQVTSDMSATYVVTNCGLLREMSNSTIAREIKMPDKHPLTSIALTRSDLVMFIASKYGHLFNVQIPFLDAGGGTLTNFRFFHNEITNIKITFNDMLLVTGSADGTIVIWTIVNNTDRIAPMDPDLGYCSDITIQRNDLVEKIQTISSLEIRIEQQAAEFQYQMRQGDAFHSEQMRDVHTNYCAAIEDLKDRNEQLQSQHVEELNIVTKNVAELKDEHNKAIMDLEMDFHNKILIEYQKSADIKAKMDIMREDYETKLRKSAGCLQDTIEALENDFKQQLQERQDLIRELMKEIESKKQEFVEYCRLVENDNDRKIIEFQLQYEKKMKDENDAMLKWRADAGVLNKRFTSVSLELDKLQKEKVTLLEEHYKTKAIITNHLKDYEELKKEIEDRDETIHDKEKRVNELLKKNNELEKYKQVMMNKITELKAQIEPREREIKEKKDQTIEMEKELEGLEQNIFQSEIQFAEFKDKYNGKEIDLKVERDRGRHLRSQIYQICSDIYKLSGYVQQPNELKGEVMKLYHRYADDKLLKDSIKSDTEVNMEFMRQRLHLEKLLETCKSSNAKLKREHDAMNIEMNRLKTEALVQKNSTGN